MATVTLTFTDREDGKVDAVLQFGNLHKKTANLSQAELIGGKVFGFTGYFNAGIPLNRDDINNTLSAVLIAK